MGDRLTIRLRVIEDDNGLTDFLDDADFSDEEELLVDVPAAEWTAYLAAQQAMWAAHAALCASIGFDTHGGTALKPCASYRGHAWPSIGGVVFHDSCWTCGRTYPEHTDQEAE